MGVKKGGQEEFTELRIYKGWEWSSGATLFK